MKRKQIRVSLITLSIMAMLSIGCNKDDNAQPQETPVVNKAPVISAQTFTIAENVADDTVIGTVIATDPEKKLLTYILTQNSNDLFELTEVGELSLVADKKLDFETTTMHTLTIEVSDGTHKASADITITVENVEEAFITTWETTTANEEITFRFDINRTYDSTIDWGDGTIDTNVTSTPLHTYAIAGVYTVKVSGKFPSVNMNCDNEDVQKLKTIEQWGDIVWESFHVAFSSCENMKYNATDVPNLSKVTIMSGMFAGAASFNGDLSKWNVSNVTNMDRMFGAESFNGDLSTWDVSKVTDMNKMFYGATSFNRDLNNWNVSMVTNMTEMFGLADSFNGDISQWDVSKVTNMDKMFVGAISFNRNLSKWDVSNVTNMDGMFARATSFKGDLSTWNVSKVTNMTFMFNGAISFKGDLSTWDVSNVTIMYNMLSNTNMSTTNYDALLTKWATLPNLQSNVAFGVHGLTYCDAYAARSTLINDKNWTFTGDNSCPR